MLGWRTVCAVEWEPYAASVLAARQNDGLLPPFPIWDDVRTFDGRPWRGLVDVVSGGFPCQDISVAGNGDGLDGERSGLWSEMARIIGELRPRFAFVENSPALTSRGLGRVLGDLASLGYDARWGVVSAADAGAPHRRERIWILAYSNQVGRDGRARQQWEGRGIESKDSRNSVADANCLREPQPEGGERNERGRPSDSSQDLADARSEHAQRLVACDLDPQEWAQSGERSSGSQGYGNGWWAAEPDVGRAFDGLACGLDGSAANE